MSLAPQTEQGQRFDQAVPLERRAFYDDAICQREFSAVFAPSWQFVGFESELPDPGDYVVRRMGNDNVVVTRDEGGTVNVLLNSCSHRGTQLCRATFGNSAHFRCSYHGWTYSNDGRLTAVPHLRTHYPRDFDKSAFDLRRARVASYRGFIFATWNEQAPTIEDYLGEIRWYIDAMLDLAGGEWEVYGPPQRSVSKGNWKVPTDNFAGDGYHMGTTHQSAFEMGIYGDSLASGTLGQREMELIGINIATDQGHSLRAGYVVEKGKRDIARHVDDPVYIGYPRELWSALTASQTPEQVRFNSHLEVLHGTIFPNLSYLSVSHDKAIGRPDDPLTKYTVWRVHSPIDARHTECLYWTLVPSMMSQEWKQRSYEFQARSQSAGGILFEMDDFENFARIDASIAGNAAGSAPLDLSLGLALGEPLPDFPGPGAAEYVTLSEHNQRAFYRRWTELMKAGDSDDAAFA